MGFNIREPCGRSQLRTHYGVLDRVLASVDFQILVSKWNESLPHGAILNIKDEQKLTASLAPGPTHPLRGFPSLHPGPLSTIQSSEWSGEVGANGAPRDDAQLHLRCMHQQFGLSRLSSGGVSGAWPHTWYRSQASWEMPHLWKNHERPLISPAEL